MKPAGVLGLVLGLSATGAACGGAAPTSPGAATPTAVEAAVTGSWSGTFKVATCSGNCERPDDPSRFALRLSGSSGVLVIGQPVSVPWQVPLVVDVTSVPSASGFVITGQSPVPAGPGDSRAVDVRLELNGLGDQLSGTVRYSWPDPAAPGITTKQGTILSSSRELPVAASEFHGVWAGRIARTSCTGDCGVADPVVGDGSVRLAIVQTGSAATATYNAEMTYAPQRLIGTAGGHAISLSYREETRTCAPNSFTDVMCLLDISISGFADTLDRMTGTVTYRADWFQESSGRHYSMTGTADLTRIARWQ